MPGSRITLSFDVTNHHAILSMTIDKAQDKAVFVSCSQERSSVAHLCTRKFASKAVLYARLLAQLKIGTLFQAVK